jgi:hypothetical protein
MSRVRDIRKRAGIDALLLPRCSGAERPARLKALWRGILEKAAASSRPRQPLVLDEDFDAAMRLSWAKYGHADAPLPPDPGWCTGHNRSE